HVAAAVAVAPFDKPMGSTLTVRMDGYFARPPIVARRRRVVKALAHLEGAVDAGRVERVGEISGFDLFECPRPVGGLAVWSLGHVRSHTASRLRCSSVRPNSFTASASAVFASGASMVPRLWARERRIVTCQRRSVSLGGFFVVGMAEI